MVTKCEFGIARSACLFSTKGVKLSCWSTLKWIFQHLWLVVKIKQTHFKCIEIWRVWNMEHFPLSNQIEATAIFGEWEWFSHRWCALWFDLFNRMYGVCVFAFIWILMSMSVLVSIVRSFIWNKLMIFHSTATTHKHTNSHLSTVKCQIQHYQDVQRHIQIYTYTFIWSDKQ